MTSTNLYEVSYTDFDAKDEQHPHGRHVVVGEQLATNGIEAIYSILRSRGVDESALQSARHLGSIKRLTIAGITFEAKKLS